MANLGNLSVQVRSDDPFFGESVPVEIRDSKMRLVQQDRRQRQFDLPAGLYQVSAVLEDGRRYSKLVEVRPGQRIPVELGVSEPSQVPESPAQGGELESLPQSKGLDGLAYERPRYMQRLESLPTVAPESQAGSAAQLLGVSGASLVRKAHLLWVFECTEAPDSVPTALLRIGEQKIRISLPLSAEDGHPAISCVVQVEETRTGAHANAWIARERTLANALQNMWASGNVLSAADVANDAVDLLQYKYSDPTGAALGALILHRVGELEKQPRLVHWVENLANDFPWLPDGKVLLAHLWHSDPSRMEQALDLAIQASTQRMLYTESYSLLLELLRRWQRGPEREATRLSTNKLASLAPYINWESICLSEVVQE